MTLRQLTRDDFRTRATGLARRVTGALLICLLAVPVRADAQLEYINAERLGEIIAAERGKVLLVNFWATWCSPCLKEIPALMSLAEDYADEDFRLIAVSLDDPEQPSEIVTGFIERFFPGFVTYARVDYTMDDTVSVLDPGWNEILPTSYLIGRDGKLAMKIQGGKSREDFAEALEPLLAE